MKRKILAIILSLTMISGCGVSQSGQITDTEAGKDNSSAIENAEKTENTENAEDTDKNDESAELPELSIIDDNYRTTYEIFVYSFYDSDGDGIGDLKGVTQKLDYINDGDDTTDSDLGCNQIWLMPISPSTTYHKYDITDYKAIDPEYGTMEDFEELVKACHDRKVRVIIDLVLNHTSNEHPWFQEAYKYLKEHPDLESTDQEECPYLNYYNFTKEKQTGCVKLNGTDWYYEARFWSGMPDLNLDNEKVRQEISDITKFWIDKGVDGFRLDAVTSYYTNNDSANIEFMTWLNDTIKGQKNDAYIVGEAWTALSTYSTYYSSGIDSFFNFDFSGSEGTIASVARGKKSPLAFAKAMQDAEKEFESNNANYVDAPFYTNHDMARSAGYFVGKGSEAKVKMAGALNLLMGGNAFIYYGEELGMKGSGKDENKRAPMQWADAASEGMCKGPKDMEKFNMIYPTLEEQKDDENSIYNYYKKAIRLRNTYPVIARGKTQPVEVLSEDKVGAFVRYNNPLYSSNSEDYIVFNSEAENVGMTGTAVKPALGIYEDETSGPSSLLIIINNSDEEKKIDLSKWSGTGENPELAYELCVSEDKVSLTGKEVSIPSYGIAVIKD